ncbi:uncharacterized protein KY384_006927 [Bacidia gigantensis]|uniref:uncharacterized protein n=1 Tax=Bacidia gigantensis TaxID=2732470 RepID=UPI001D05921D|nr:uncharacterized protein KY384_006927 [Bacidia gigantensis]KAG8528011.1 hypothetical protein KY384_006927 [Bacidia gigantensis]
MDSKENGGGGREATKAFSDESDKDAPDPEEGDLDDLDDMLDEFSTAKASQFQDPNSEPIPHPSDKETPSESAAETNAFSEDLQEQMAALLGERNKSPEVEQGLEAMMRSLGSANNASEPSISDKTPLNAEESFRDTIRKTMERMQTSSDQAGSAGHGDGTDDFMGQMLKELSGGEVPADGNEEGFNKMLLGMMEQLTNKEILYDPMKELHDKFPSWIERNHNNIDPRDMKNFYEQQKLVGEIVERFERRTYSDSNTADREFIVDRMQQMQAAGSPPADLVGDMDAADTLNSIDTGCAQQ